MSFPLDDRLIAPQVLWEGRWCARETVAGLAAAWAGMLAALPDSAPTAVYAAAVPHGPEGVALFLAALSTRRVPVLLSHDPMAWPDAASLRPGLTLVLPPSLGGVADEAERRGYHVVRLPAGVSSSAPLAARTAGVVFLTSGSTGRPRPVFRTLAALDANARARCGVLGFERGDGFLGGVPIGTGQGITQTLTAVRLGGALGWLNRLDFRSAFDTIGRPEFQCWWATPHLADLLGRCHHEGPARAPRVCLVSSPLAAGVHERFLARFGVPLRQAYSSTETGAVAVDGGPPSTVVPGTVGHLLPGVDVRIGERPDASAQPGEAGRIWVSSPYRMAGYGLPPDVVLDGTIDGYLPTNDIGVMDRDGRLTLKGRTDDRVRTREGRVVDLELTNAVLRAIPGVRASVVLPFDGAAGVIVAALIECSESLSLDSVRARLAAELPRWSLPRSFLAVPRLPRLANGKPDRVGARALLSAVVHP